VYPDSSITSHIDSIGFYLTTSSSRCPPVLVVICSIVHHLTQAFLGGVVTGFTHSFNAVVRGHRGEPRAGRLRILYVLRQLEILLLFIIISVPSLSRVRILIYSIGQAE
jgi:hypothetical protein